VVGSADPETSEERRNRALRAGRRADSDTGRVGDGQGTGGEGNSSPQRAAWATIRDAQLRRSLAGAPAERALRSRASLAGEKADLGRAKKLGELTAMASSYDLWQRPVQPDCLKRLNQEHST